ncbi:MAG: ISKra4 family transposase [Lentisphaerae bacterium]|nr:ISKra4 family transposase [Lentisphaerota bacterium]
MTDADVVEWLYERAAVGLPADADMGRMEKAVEAASLDVRRQVVEGLVQRTADRCAAACPGCGRRLLMHVRGRRRRVVTRCGPIRFRRDYGRCPACGRYSYPADVALGLHERAPASPVVQEICALETLAAPAGRKARDVRRLTGLEIDPSVMHREARRQGEAALALRDKDVAMAQTPKGVAELAASAAPGLPGEPFTLVIEIDAWNIRERDAWGRTAKLAARGEKPERWHWVYTATVFRLDQRGTTASGRPVISERGYVATRKGLDAFKQQLYAEALRRGLLQAAHVLILADGAVWIWDLAEDRFKGASQRVDLYHVEQHLCTLAADLHGGGTEAAREWVAPYRAWLTSRKDGALDVLRGLEGLRDAAQTLATQQRAALDREIGYFNKHKGRMDYKNAKKLGQPVGSGAIESTCSQYQRRFKLTGQFWSLAGDEAFLALDTLHRNERWHLLFPHDCD